MGSLIGLLIFIADIYGIVMTIQSNDSKEKKILWVLLIFILPVVGLALWYFLGPRKK